MCLKCQINHSSETSLHYRGLFTLFKLNKFLHKKINEFSLFCTKQAGYGMI